MLTLRESIESDTEGFLFSTTGGYAEEVSYKQGMQTVEGVPAIFKDVSYQVEGEEGFVTQVNRVEIQIPVAELPGKKPRAGDQVVRTSGGTEMVYEVMPIEEQGVAVSRDETLLIWKLQSKQIR